MKRPAISLSFFVSLLIALFVYLFFLLPAISSANEMTPRVIGGTPATGSTWPSQVALLDASRPSVEDAWFCGGTVVGRRWVLTAAHCVVNLSNGQVYSPSLIDILLGQKDLSGSGGKRIALKGIYVPRSYDYQNVASLGDLALLNLKEDAAPAMAIGRPDQASTWAPGQGVFVAGYGADSATLISETPRDVSYTFPGKLLEAELDVKSYAFCQGAYGDIISKSSMICASAPGKDSCVGDSGGPLATGNGQGALLVGVVSFGTDTCDSSLAPGVYTRLTAYRNWIGSYMVSSLQSKGSVAWGSVRRKSAKSKRIYLHNTSNLPGQIKQKKISGSSRFSVTGGDCPSYLEAGQSCFVRVRFYSKKKGVYKSQLQIRSAREALARINLSARVH